MTTTNQNIDWFVLNPDQMPASAEDFKRKFNADVIGQEKAQEIALNAFERANNPLRDPTKPIAIYVLVGPSRTGKTRTAKITSKIVHKDENALTIIEAGDYVERHQMLDLTGATPTYVGYQRPDEVKRLGKEEVDGTSKISGHNLRRVRLNSQSEIDIVCINEFEKATDDFFRFWMGAWDNGFVIHGNGMKTDFRNTIFFVTMNLGMDEVERMARRPGFVTSPEVVTQQDIQTIVDEAMRKRWPPEFRNRLTSVVLFRPLTREEIFQICSLELREVQTRINTQMKKSAFALNVTDEAREWLVAKAFEDNGNVAQLKRVVEKHVSDALGRELHKGTIRGVNFVSIDRSEDGSALVFKGGRNIVPTPGPNATTAETFEFRLQRAKSAQRHGDVPGRFYRVWLITDNANEANRFNAQLEQDLTEIFNLVVISSYKHTVEPYTVSKTVHTTLEMSFLIKERMARQFPNVQVTMETPAPAAERK